MSLASQDALTRVDDALAKADLPAVRTQLNALEKAHPQDGRVGVLRARLMAGEGDVAGATVKLRKLTEDKAAGPLARGYLGAVLVAQRQYQEALAHLQAARDAKVNDAPIAHALGVALASQGNHAQALPLLVDACTRMPASGPSWFYAGICHAEAGDFDAAAKALIQCVQVQPGYEEAWEALCRVEISRGNEPVARKLLEEGLKQTKGSLVLRRYQVGLLTELGDSAGAFKALEAIPAASRNAQDLCNLSMLCMEKKDRANALKHAQAAVKLDGAWDRAHFVLGLALEGQQPMDRAAVINAYKKAIAAGDASGAAGTRLGFVLMESNDKADLQAAVDILEAAVERSEDAPGAVLNLALAYARSGDKSKAKAMCSVILADKSAAPSDAEQAERLMKTLG